MRVDIKKISRVSVRQHDSTDCGSACLASLIRFYGGNITIERVRNLSGTSQRGTTMLGLYQAAIECGMTATGYEAAVTDLLTYPSPLILHVSNDNRGEHYIVFYGIKEEKAVVWDPGEGLRIFQMDDLQKIWVSGKCLAVMPGNGFATSVIQRKEKLRWVSEMLKPEKDVLLSCLLAGAVISALGVVMAVFTQKLLDNIIPSHNQTLLILTVVLVMILLSVRTILGAARQYLLLSQGRSFNIRIVDRFMRSLLALPKPFFETRRTGDMVARLNDTMRIQHVVSDIASSYIIDLLVVVITMAVMFAYSLIAGVISLALIPVFILMVYRWNIPVVESQRRMMAGYAANESNFIDTLKGITEIKGMLWQGIFSTRNREIFTLFQDRVIGLGRLKIRLGLFIGQAGILYLCLLIGTGSFLVMNDHLSQGELMAVISLGSAILPSVMSLALVAVPLSEAGVAIGRMFEFTRIKPEGCDSVTTGMDASFTRVTLQNISFRFPGQPLLLKDITLGVERGGITGLVGESGSGKSTLVNIMMRFHTPETGSLQVNGALRAEELSLDLWRQRIRLVPQEVHIFNGTLLDNIIAVPDQQKLDRLTSLVSGYSLEPFISCLPAGFATQIGEEGVKLSGGQKQVLAFLRAMVDEPEILIVDEGTSAMDHNTELLFARILRSICDHCGILLVTHRMNLARKLCDRIFILESGTISMSGSHDDLMKYDSIYSTYWNEMKKII